MVKLSELIYTTDEGNVGLPLPLGPTIKGTTVVNNPVISLTASEFNTHRSTDEGWPTVITGIDVDNKKLGIALYYPGAINDDIPEQEINFVVNSNKTSLGVLSFTNKSMAVNRFNHDYEIEGYGGYEEIPRSDWGDMRPDEMKDFFDKKVTPIIYEEDMENRAVAIQRGETVSDIFNLFGLHFVNKVKKRKKIAEDKFQESEHESNNTSSLDEIWDDTINNNGDQSENDEE
jgi:hypothetical protein